MKKNPFLAALCLPVLLTACGGDSGSGSSSSAVTVDSSGNCTEQFIADYNSVITASKTANLVLKSTYYSDSEKRAHVQTVSNACDKLFSTHGKSISCRATVEYREKQISPSDHQLPCSQAKAMLAPVTSPATASEPKPEEGSFRMEGLGASQLKVRVLDAFLLKKLVSGNQDQVMINGRVGTMESFRYELMRGATACYVTGAATGRSVLLLTNNTTLNVSAKSEEIETSGRRLKLLFLDPGFALVCAKHGSDSFTMKELRDATQGVMEISVTP